jgi:hypothetical protein
MSAELWELVVKSQSIFCVQFYTKSLTATEGSEILPNCLPRERLSLRYFSSNFKNDRMMLSFLCRFTARSPNDRSTLSGDSSEWSQTNWESHDFPFIFPHLPRLFWPALLFYIRFKNLISSAHAFLIKLAVNPWVNIGTRIWYGASTNRSLHDN